MVVNVVESRPSDRGETVFPTVRAKRNHVLLISACLLASISVSLIISTHYLPMVMDDALISDRYSDRLLHGRGLTWNDGEFVEGYSNLLWVLLVALGGLLQPNLVHVGWVLGSIANVATLISITWAFLRKPTASITAVLVGLLFIACSESFAFWAIGGMETALVVALLGWALALTYRMPSERSRSAELYASCLFGLLAITRPDGVLFGFSVGIGQLIRNGISRTTIRRLLGFVGVPLIFMGLQIAFRLAYYGSPVPNTSLAKLAFNLERMLDGASYVAKGAMANGALLATVVATAAVLYKSRGWEVFRQNAVSIVPGVVWLAYICAIGGDWFPFERQWQPAFICFAFAASGAVSMLSPLRPWATTVFAIAVVVLHVTSQATVNPYLSEFDPDSNFMKTMRSELRRADPSGRAEREYFSTASVSRAELLRGYQRDYHQCVAFGGLLRSAFNSEHPLIAVNGAGCLPFFSELPAIDMLGLTDSYIANHPPPDMGHGPVGHELGDGAYVLSRKPDLIVFCGWGELLGVVVPCFRSDRQVAQSAEFLKYYRMVRYRVDDFDMQAWTRIEDGRLGIKRAGNRIHIPGFLLATTSGVHAVLDSTGMLIASLQDGDALIEDVNLPSGVWEVSLEADRQSRLQLSISPASGSMTLGPRTLRIVTEGGPRSFRVSGDRGVIYGIIAKRVRGESGTSSARQPSTGSSDQG